MLSSFHSHSFAPSSSLFLVALYIWVHHCFFSGSHYLSSNVSSHSTLCFFTLHPCSTSLITCCSPVLICPQLALLFKNMIQGLVCHLPTQTEQYFFNCYLSYLSLLKIRVFRALTKNWTPMLCPLKGYLHLFSLPLLKAFSLALIFFLTASFWHVTACICKSHVTRTCVYACAFGLFESWVSGFTQTKCICFCKQY